MNGTHHSGPPPPPPPPPHGQNPKSSSGLPPGNYDIFIIPPHSAGSGFLYLPSLRPQTNSFVAGCVCTLLCVYVWSVLAPTVSAWWNTVSSSGGAVGVGVLVLAVGFAGWAFGQQATLNQQNPGSGNANSAGAGAQRGHQGGPPPGGFKGASSPPPNNSYGGTPPPNPGHGYGRPPPGGYGQHQSPPNGNYSRQHSDTYGDSSYGARTPPAWEEPDPFERYSRQKARTQPPGSEPDFERPNPRPRAYSNASANWQKAREKVARENEERKRAEEEKKRAEEERKKKEEAEKAARAAAEKERWEQMRQREKEQREREVRERIARERLAKEKEKIEKERKEKEDKERKEREEKGLKEKGEREKAKREARIKAARDRIEQAKSERSTPVYGVGERTNPYSLGSASSPKVAPPNPTASEPARKTYEKPSAKSYAGTSTAESFRPYDTPRMPKPQPSTSTFYSSEYSYAPSQSTAPTSPPASHRGPYRTSDPEKVVIKGVFLFTDSFPKPVSTLISGQDGITDGLVLRITTEGMFVDDDVKQQGLRQWDIKAWTMKGIETATKNHLHILRTLIRDAEGKKYVYLIPEEETWKVVEGIQRLKRGSLVQRCLTGPLNSSDATRLLNMLGFA